MEIEKHSRWEKYPRKGDLIRDLRTFFNYLDQSVDPVPYPAVLLEYDYEELPNGALKSVAGLGLYTYDETSVAVPDGINTLDTGNPVGRWIKVTTGGGGSTGYSMTSLAFSPATVPLVTVVPLPIGARVDGVTVEVVTAFDGVGASVLVGTPSDPSLYFGVGKSSLAVGGRSYHKAQVHTALVAESLILTFNAAGSMVGLGRVHVRVQLPLWNREMADYQNLAGTTETGFQIGIDRAQVTSTSTGELQVRDATDSAYARLRVGAPVADNDAVTKAYADTLAKPLIVTGQFDGNDPLPANTGVRHFQVVSTTGANASIGDLIFDNGTGAGTAEVLVAVEGRCIVVSDALSGGTVTFDPDSIYIWDADGSAWVKIGDIGAVTGAERVIRYTITNAATQDSVSLIPANAIVSSCEVKITTPYSGGATISVGRAGSLALVMPTTGNNPQGASGNIYRRLQDTSWGGSALVVRTTIAGAPAAGAGVVIVKYFSANA